jgi:hypothetical protein
MHPVKKAARVAGLLYLSIVIMGPFLLLYVPGKLIVAGDASATAANFLSHQSLVRAHIVVGVLAELAFIAVALALYRLLRGVNAELAAVMVILVLLDAPLAFLGVANEVATLAFLRAPGILAVFEGPQRDALATLLLGFGNRSVPVDEVFWGLWLLPLAMLVYRSRFLPRFLGVWLFANGLAYLALSATGVLWPERLETVNKMTLPVLFGEVAFTLWLLIVGARVPPPEAAAPVGAD